MNNRVRFPEIFTLHSYRGGIQAGGAPFGVGSHRNNPAAGGESSDSLAEFARRVTLRLLRFSLALEANRVGGEVTLAVLPHHRTCGSASGGS